MHPPLAQTLASAWPGLSLYVLGPGIGECQVLLLPGGTVVVVDACMQGARNLTVEFLRALGVARVDLFVLTHPDQDHVRGAGGVLRAFPPHEIWVYPHEASLRDLLVRAKRLALAKGRTPSDALTDLTDFVDALQPFEARMPRAVRAVRGSTRTWTPAGSGCAITPLAPSADDEAAAYQTIRAQLLRHDSKAGEIHDWVEEFLLDGTRAGDSPNALSIALAVEWEGRRILLGGDVEHDPAHAGRGWAGMMTALDDPADPRLGLLRGLDAVKIAHHGSHGAICEPAWTLHRQGMASPIDGVIAPFTRHRKKLPAVDGLTALRGFGLRLAITHTTADTHTRATAAGWTEDTSVPRLSEDFPMVALRLRRAGPVELSRWGDATVWRP